MSTASWGECGSPDASILWALVSALLSEGDLKDLKAVAKASPAVYIIGLHPERTFKTHTLGAHKER